MKATTRKRQAARGLYLKMLVGVKLSEKHLSKAREFATKHPDLALRLKASLVQQAKARKAYAEQVATEAAQLLAKMERE